MPAVEWSRPRQTPHAGHRKATERFCAACQAFHRTHRHALGEERCSAVELARERRRHALNAGPHIRAPKQPKTRIRVRPGG